VNFGWKTIHKLFIQDAATGQKEQKRIICRGLVLAPDCFGGRSLEGWFKPYSVQEVAISRYIAFLQLHIYMSFKEIVEISCYIHKYIINAIHTYVGIIYVILLIYTRCVLMISGKSQYKQTDRVGTFCIFSFCQYGLQRSSRTSGSALITAGAPRQSSPPCYFSYPHLSSYRRPPERE
jgi:hypothetical protein